ncbi:ABC-2 type transport system permease protein [Nocardiopsis arvandica]|uniref:Transport permease protein n=1 Tax=Nocardiopsis sinuspersici TaxID=501010 RepID=A0A7Y9XI85_9ACTN|nr:ABC-2 type transport system permease protein [Nocardiopsis sinuspersici]
MSTAMAVRLDAEARVVAAVWRREITTLLRGRLRLVLGLAQPMLLLATLGIGLGAIVSDGGSGVGYVTFLFPGVMVMAVQSPALATGASILGDRELGFLRGMLMAPVRRESLLLGKVLAGTTAATCHGAVLLAFAGAAGVPYDPALFTSLVAVLVPASFALTSLGTLLAVCLPGPRTFQATTGLLLGPLVLLSGVFFPLSVLPAWLTVVTALNPLTHAVEAARHTLTAHLPAAASDTLFANLRVWGLRPSTVEELVALTCFGALCLFLAVRRFSRPDQQEHPSAHRPPGHGAPARSCERRWLCLLHRNAGRRGLRHRLALGHHAGPA